MLTFNEPSNTTTTKKTSRQHSVLEWSPHIIEINESAETREVCQQNLVLVFSVND